eukprot:TRINITY_DN14735_c0_g1_i3.p1 TRINITY_DN14735_c0_g1~~TRINITY_DN14735_c0_g1_i3.p1  ORF type:complete len:181 (+),score=31.50 TRINITY_DN14735_c0_g1_i3:130-672(+)
MSLYTYLLATSSPVPPAPIAQPMAAVNVCPAPVSVAVQFASSPCPGHTDQLYMYLLAVAGAKPAHPTAGAKAQKKPQTPAPAPTAAAAKQTVKPTEASQAAVAPAPETSSSPQTAAVEEPVTVPQPAEDTAFSAEDEFVLVSSSPVQVAPIGGASPIQAIAPPPGGRSESPGICAGCLVC